MNEPTDRQIKFAAVISKALRIPLPEVFTKQAYWEFISANKDKIYDFDAYVNGDTYIYMIAYNCVYIYILKNIII